MQLDFDKWDKNINKGESIELSPKDFNIVIEKLNALNQKEFTQIILGGTESYLLIGGGNNQFICTFCTRDNEHFYNLINNSINNNNEIDIVTGGQEGTFNNNLVNNKADILKAMKYYFETEKMNPIFKWEEEI